jgi:protein-tyrosine-phosphatase
VTGERSRVLLVCTGNTCRSPLAELIARDMWGDQADVSSAGSLAGEGVAASENAIRVAAELGLDLTEFRTSPLSGADEPDLVFAMEPSHVTAARQAFPNLPDNAVRLLDPAGIDDPMDEPLDVYRQVAVQITAALEAIELSSWRDGLLG